MRLVYTTNPKKRFFEMFYALSYPRRAAPRADGVFNYLFRDKIKFPGSYRILERAWGDRDEIYV